MQQIKTVWNTTVGKLGAALILILACYSCVTTNIIANPPAEEQQITEDQARQTAEALAWLYVTQTAESIPAFTATITFTPTLALTATPSNTPAPTQTPAPTIDPLYDAKTSGFYLVNVEIAPGVWKSNGSGDGCYWAVTTASGEIIDNHFGQAGGTAYIPANGFQVEFNRCGTWVFIQNP